MGTMTVGKRRDGTYFFPPGWDFAISPEAKEEIAKISPYWGADENWKCSHGLDYFFPSFIIEDGIEGGFQMVKEILACPLSLRRDFDLVEIEIKAIPVKVRARYGLLKHGPYRITLEAKEYTFPCGCVLRRGKGSPPKGHSFLPETESYCAKLALSLLEDP